MATPAATRPAASSWRSVIPGDQLRIEIEADAERRAFIEAKCGDNQPLREEVERLQEAASGNREQMSLLGDEE